MQFTVNDREYFDSISDMVAVSINIEDYQVSVEAMTN